jgi:hypothetical protein
VVDQAQKEYHYVYLAYCSSRIDSLHTFQVVDMSRMQKLMDCLSGELSLAHWTDFLDQVYTFAADRAYYAKFSIDKSQLEMRLTAVE